MFSMKKIGVIIGLLILTACNQKITEQDIAKLNGYWEIEKVILSDGSEKTYPMNETFDYFDVHNNVGFRKKVKPQFNGRFVVDNQAEKVTVVYEKDKTYINYSTPYTKWREELKSLSDEQMVLTNASNISYHYKKAAPINLLEDGEKTQ